MVFDRKKYPKGILNCLSILLVLRDFVESSTVWGGNGKRPFVSTALNFIFLDLKYRTKSTVF